MRPVVRHGAIVYAGTAFSSLLMLAVKVYINRFMGTEALGKYEFGLSVVLLMSVFSLFGLHTTIARFVAKEGERAHPLVRKAFVWIVSVSLILVIATNLAVNWLYRSRVEPNFVLNLSLLLLAVCLLNLNISFFQGRQKMGNVSLIMILDSVTRVCAVALAVWLAVSTPRLLLMIGLFSLAFELVVTFSLVLSTNRAPKSDDVSFREALGISSLIFLIAASGAISTRVSAFVIQYRLDALNLGWFAMATLFTLPLSLLGKTIETVLLPRASQGREFQLGRIAVAALVLSIFTVAAYQLVSGFLVRFLFGPGNSEATTALRILSVGFSAVLVYSVFSAFIFGRASHRFLKLLVVATFVQSLLVAPTLNSYLVGKMALSGAAWATTLTLMLQAVLWATAGIILHRRNR